jgi:hypothetical protein
MKGPSVVVIVVLILASFPAFAQDARMSFFITSVGSGKGGNLGGLTGADQLCQRLAAAAGAGSRTWRAYLSTTGPGGVNARDRIGKGPWYNYKGVMVAQSVADLHSDKHKISKENSLTEKGVVLPGQNEPGNIHHLLTGTKTDGTAAEQNCNNWTSGNEGTAMLGHHDATGRGGPTSWNGAHASTGCSQEAFKTSDGDGRIACFAVN